MRVLRTSGGVHVFHEFLRVLHFRDFIAQQIRYPRRNQDYNPYYRDKRSAIGPKIGDSLVKVGRLLHDFGEKVAIFGQIRMNCAKFGPVKSHGPGKTNRLKKGNADRGRGPLQDCQRWEFANPRKTPSLRFPTVSGIFIGMLWVRRRWPAVLGSYRLDSGLGSTLPAAVHSGGGVHQMTAKNILGPASGCRLQPVSTLPAYSGSCRSAFRSHADH
jgi:hypothetical protein